MFNSVGSYVDVSGTVNTHAQTQHRERSVTLWIILFQHILCKM